MANQVRTVMAMRLRVLRRAQRMTQDDVATKLNIHRTTYTKYESGVADPEPSRLLELANLFHVTVDFLLGKSDAPNPHPADAVLCDGTLFALSEKEMALVAGFRRMKPDEQAVMLRYAGVDD